jgi:iron complex outermembrane recepter protein
MGYRIYIIGLFFTSAVAGHAQEKSSPMSDSTFQLEEIKVEGYSYNRPPLEVPAAIGIIGYNELQRFSNTSLLPALNTIPGVRMEERSPGSYRLAIRGSSLRSPFGVRNVKVYWNDLPFTDAGGNTYINLFDFNTIARTEVIKGPGSSLYGVGTGGVILLKSNVPKNSSAGITSVVGSYGLVSYGLNTNWKSEKTYANLQYNHQQSDGYRQQTAMVRDVVQAEAAVHSNRNTFQFNLLYADLTYETPGALTLQQYQQDPKQARPAGGPNKSAVEQKAAIHNQTVYAGINHIYEWNNSWSTETGFYGNYTDFKNPAIRNFEKRTEKGFGGRLNNQYQFDNGRINFGGEYQHGFSPINIYDNNQGTRGNLQSSDEIGLETYFIFSQVELFLPAQFFLTLGASLNKLNVDFKRLSTIPSVSEDRKFKAVFSPRIALLKKITPETSVYASFSKGYSPPTIQELYPSTAVFDKNLNPETGTNYEVGFHGQFLNRSIFVDVAAYSLVLDETIAIRRQEDGAEYFTNAGRTLQQGIETKIQWSPHLDENAFVNYLGFWVAATLNDYTFQDFLTVIPSGDSIDLSEKSLTGVPSRVYTYGADLRVRDGVYLNLTLNYTSEIPLNDEHSQSSKSYSVLSGKIGFRHAFQNLEIDVFTGVDNALDEKYSLGNDLNTLGGRFFNAAPRRNYFTGLKALWNFSRKKS